MAGSLFGRAQRYLNEVKSEVSREIELEELRKMHQDVQRAASHMEQSIAGDIDETRRSIHDAWHGNGSESNDGSNPLNSPSMPDQLAVKAKEFRRKKLARSSAIPAWYARENGRRSRVISGAARVVRYRHSSLQKPPASFH